MKLMVPGLLAIATLCSQGTVHFEPRLIDEGTLASTSTGLSGPQTSTEEFKIVQNADGGYTMTTISSGGRQMRSVLTTDPLGNPIAYEHHGKGGEASEKTITSKRDEGGTLVITELSSRNPPAPLFRFPPNTLLLGDGGAAQLWFLGLRPAPRDVDYFPTGIWTVGVQKARWSEVGPDPVTIEGTPVPATHFALTGGLLPRDVWLDSQKRLLAISSSRGNFATVRTKRPQ